jgi:hypothetical protein
VLDGRRSAELPTLVRTIAAYLARCAGRFAYDAMLRVMDDLGG